MLLREQKLNQVFSGNIQLEASQILYPEELTCLSFLANNKGQFHVSAKSKMNLKSPQGHLLSLVPCQQLNHGPTPAGDLNHLFKGMGCFYTLF